MCILSCVGVFSEISNCYTLNLLLFVPLSLSLSLAAPSGRDSLAPLAIYGYVVMLSMGISLFCKDSPRMHCVLSIMAALIRRFRRTACLLLDVWLYTASPGLCGWPSGSAVS